MNALMKEQRKKKGYSQERIARLLDISLQAYQNIENHDTEPRVTVALKIARLLDIDPYLLYNIK